MSSNKIPAARPSDAEARAAGPRKPSEARGRALTASRDADLVGPRTERDLQRFEAYCRWSLHIMVMLCAVVTAMQVLMAVAARFGEGRALLGPAVVGPVIAWAVFSSVVLDLVCRERSVPRPILWLWAVVSLLFTVGAAALVPRDGIYREGAGTLIGLGPLGLAASVGVLALLISWRRAVLVAVAGLGVLGAMYVLGPPQLGVPGTVAMLLMTVWFCVGSIPMAMTTRWMIDVVRRLWRSRQVAADLAVAEERLRFSRDLHDVFGRTLSTVTIKSELAAEFARRGDERAVAEMEAVREVAQTALAEVRGLVRGYRQINLKHELAGAKSILRAAGLTPVVSGTVEEVTARLAPEAAEALAWVVREGLTNVLRHGRGGTVRINLFADEHGCGVTIENDTCGVTGNGTGAGLVGLRERIEAVGGVLHVQARDGTFHLTARIPQMLEAAASSPAVSK
ncbi:sensor histidine kinase [Dermatophilus congolensis]|nr:histidine kinase [Dermatophilus congolensis]MBO3130238.1 two-component sensor histidine kinase [Dermatophilus congolensis]MBO3131133.1 two-component sensor histidine kinase [Dermatophilus congolensis]MBO3134709.1 two-component sensor histidine kinase [Dermatophilus congolensis]MBO3136944.1 two-component sensor histidine kinase [Dermatophilus congolensis]MBO3139190.1 two-component sensor histidine kinase [Dermatophilus congolensis]